MSAQTDSGTYLRPMLPADVPVLAAIFQASIEELAEDDYDDAQREAWAAAADDEAVFGKRLLASLTIVATIRGAPIGFISLEGTERLDMLYVYPPVVRRGVATLLLNAVEKLAVGRGAKVLRVDSSDVARPFFDARGFTAVARQTVAIGDVWIGNTRMEKTLG